MNNFDGVQVLSEPLVVDKYEFLFEHIGCDCLGSREENRHTPMIKVYAYAKRPYYNLELDEYSRSPLNTTGGYIIRGIDESEVNSIG